MIGRLNIAASAVGSQPTTSQAVSTASGRVNWGPIGGRYFDVIDTEYVIKEVPNGSLLRVAMHYRVSTNFNWYVRPIARFLVVNFETTALTFYAQRAEANLMSETQTSS